MIEKKLISPKEAVALVKDGFSIMWGGFMGCGSATCISTAMSDFCNYKDLTLICNDGGWGMADKHELTGPALMIEKKLFSSFIGCHIGLNKELQRQMSTKECKVELIPMGTFIERIRCAGSGLGGVLTPTGIGTEVEEGKQILEVDGKKYLLELPLSADIAFIKAKKADKAGNLVYNQTARNFNPVMATAAKIVVAEIEELVEIGEIDPDEIHTPMIFIDYLVQGEK